MTQQHAPATPDLLATGWRRFADHSTRSELAAAQARLNHCLERSLFSACTRDELLDSLARVSFYAAARRAAHAQRSSVQGVSALNS